MVQQTHAWGDIYERSIYLHACYHVGWCGMSLFVEMSTLTKKIPDMIRIALHQLVTSRKYLWGFHHFDANIDPRQTQMGMGLLSDT